MTAIAIATLVTSIAAVWSAVVSVDGKKNATAFQRFLFFGGLFGATWASAVLIGAGQ